MTQMISTVTAQLCGSPATTTAPPKDWFTLYISTTLFLERQRESPTELILTNSPATA